MLSTTSKEAQYSSQYHFLRTSKNDDKIGSPPVTPNQKAKKGSRKQPAPSSAGHRKGTNLEAAGNDDGQLPSDRLTPPKKARRHPSDTSTSSVSSSSSCSSSSTQLEIDDSKDVNDADKADQESIKITVWHGDHCPNCRALKSIDEIFFARLQHHYRYCATHCVHYHLMADIEKRVVTNEKIKDKYEKLSSIYRPEQAQRLCQLLAEYPQAVTSAGLESPKKAAKQLFKKAATLSGELLGPAETAAFDCDRYEEYMRLLLEIAKIIKADAQLIGDIEMYLKPFERDRMETRSTPCKPYMKWDETFFDLKHSPEDDNFGRNLKEIIEAESGENSFLFPTEYKAKCHGII